MITKAIMRKFQDLACALSPKNLKADFRYIDRELSPAKVQARQKRLMRRWRLLEIEVGRKVSEDEVWTMMLEV